MIDKIEMSYILTDKYYMMLDTENDLLISTLEEMQKKSNDDIDLMLELDIIICNLNILKRVSIDIQESNLLQLSSHSAKMIKDLLGNCINYDMSEAERIDLQMIRGHIDRDCTLVITR